VKAMEVNKQPQYSSSRWSSDSDTDDEELKALSIQLQSSPTFQRVSEQAEGDLPELSYMTSLVDAATRMVFSRPFSLFYMTMVFLNSVLLIWTILGASPESSLHGLYIVLEVVVVISFSIDVLLRIVASWKRLSRCEDFKFAFSVVFDVSVWLLCICSLYYYIWGQKDLEEEFEELASLSLALRYSLQFIRLVLFIQRQLKTQSESIVDLESLKFEAEES